MANLDEIRRHIAEELTPSQRERGKYICPLCGSGSHGRNSTAAFSIDRDGVHGKCFSCDFYGDIFDLVAQRDGLTLEAATRQLVDKYEPGARRERSSAAADFAPAPPPERRSSHTGRGASPYSKQFRAAFDFLQRYTDNPPRTVDDWSAVCDEMTRIANENDNDELLMDLLVAAWVQIERVYKAEAVTKP